MSRLLLQSGGCYDSTNQFRYCALESTECKSKQYTFRSTMEMKQLGQRPPCTAYDDYRFTGGYCTSDLDDEVGCTNVAESCIHPDRFELNDSCTMHRDVENNSPTWFGACQNVKALQSSNVKDYRWRCAWSREECVVGEEQFQKAILPKSWFDGCNCEHVQTGACKYRKNNGEVEWYCAVSALGCDNRSDYVPAYYLEKQEGIKCDLCEYNRERDDTKPTNNPTSVAQGNVVRGRQAELRIEKDRNSNIGGIIGGAAGAAVAFSIIVTIVYMRGKGQKKSQIDEIDETMM